MKDTEDLEQRRSNTFTRDNLIKPWLKSNDEEAPEEAEVELPVNFGDALTFLGKPRQEAVQEYHDLINKHVSEELRCNTDIVALLKGKAEKVFVPEEWSGIY